VYVGGDLYPKLEKEDLREIYGEYGSKSIIESGHNDQINYPHRET
jgi:hypothetical protein